MTFTLSDYPNETSLIRLYGQIHSLQPQQQATLCMWLIASLKALAMISDDPRSFTAKETAQKLIAAYQEPYME